MTQLDVEEQRLSRQRWVETPTTRRTSDATEPVLVVRLKACKRLSNHISTLVDPIEPGGSTVSSRSGALWTGPHLGGQGDETGSRAFGISIYYLIPSYDERHGPWRPKELGRPSARSRASADARLVILRKTRMGKGLKGGCHGTRVVWFSTL